MFLMSHHGGAEYGASAVARRRDIALQVSLAHNELQNEQENPATLQIPVVTALPAGILRIHCCLLASRNTHNRESLC